MRVALVTGVTHRLRPGFAQARELARQGYHVIIGAHERGTAELLSAELRAEGHAATPMRLDLGDAAGYPEIAAEVQRRFGRLDALVMDDGDHGEGLRAALSGLLDAVPA
ncbi:SDR family NAD(P)-dependent oxidoreductase [Gryllotalpicola koreensis]|uniref:SDR family NAD(P)-dependent oxidoreductase n=1 Tax=Gryllotalpicola koreensis TaxID=993086 RepID=A0ABP8A0V0_9MICO